MKQKIVSYFAVGFLFFTQVLGGALWPVLAGFAPTVALAAAPGSVVINEVAWAGSADSANDEWIELYNLGAAAVDLTGWKIVDDQGAQEYALSGTIAAGGYYLIEDSEVTVQPNVANAVINLSLTNTGDSLVLFDETGQMIDAVNSSGGAWFAGSATTKASMERVSATVSGDDAANFAVSSGVGSNATASTGSLILGTPGMKNSVSGAQVAGAVVNMEVSNHNPAVGDVLTLTVKTGGAQDLFSYGLEMNYDPAVLAYKSAVQGAFLGSGGAVGISFQAGLENSVAGKLLVAQARTQSVKSGVSGSGILFTATFDVVGGAGSASQISFGAQSFLADTVNDLPAQFSGVQINVKAVAPPLSVDPATDAQVVAGAERYSLKISWLAPVTGAEKYRVTRRNAHGIWVGLGETAQVNFTDSDAVAGGGKTIPQLSYCYRITAVKGLAESDFVEACGKETRGLKADNNRSDRVDGRDLDNLARQFALTDADAGFDRLADTTYDGQVDGSDLIDLGMDFARLYKP